MIEVHSPRGSLAFFIFDYTQQYVLVPFLGHIIGKKICTRSIIKWGTKIMSSVTCPCYSTERLTIGSITTRYTLLAMLIVYKTCSCATMIITSLPHFSYLVLNHDCETICNRELEDEYHPMFCFYFKLSTYLYIYIANVLPTHFST